MNIQCILSIENDEQQILMLDNINNNITKEELLKIIFNELEQEEVKFLYKISTCQFDNNIDNCIQWLINENGKIYFNTDINNDNDTIENKEIKDKYLEGMTFEL